jgi:hypothetical protein
VGQSVYLALLFGGVLSLVSGVFLTRMTWRPDVEPFGRSTPMLQVMLHPERFALPRRLHAIRALNLVGGALLLGAVLVVAHEAFSVVASSR